MGQTKAASRQLPVFRHRFALITGEHYHTGTTAPTVVYTGVIPAGTVTNPFAEVRFPYKIQWDDTTGSKTFKFYFNSELVFNRTLTTGRTMHNQGFLQNKNSLILQFGGTLTGVNHAYSVNTSSSAWAGFNIDWTQDVTVTLELTLGVATENMAVRAFGVEVMN